jgi:hypothetical protein
MGILLGNVSLAMFLIALCTGVQDSVDGLGGAEIRLGVLQSAN